VKQTTPSYLLHDGLLWVFGLDDGRLHKVSLPVVTVPAGNDAQVRGRLGVVQPLLYTGKRLREEDAVLTVRTQVVR